MTNYNFTYLVKPKNKNPHYQQVKQGTNDWLQQFGPLGLNDAKIKKRIAETDLSLWSSWACPQASLEILQLHSNYVAWLFTFDDILEASEPDKFEYLAQELVNIAKGKQRNLSNHYIDNFFSAWQDIVLSHQKITSEPTHQRFIEYVEKYITGCYKEAKFLRSKQWPTIEEYIDYRHGCIGACNFFFPIEIMNKVPNDIFRDSRVQKTIKIAINHIAWVNDWYSLNKEREQGVPNYVTVVERERGLGEDQAKDYVFREIEDLTAEFNTIYQQIKAEPSQEATCAYLAGLIDIMVGNIEWSKICQRYQTDNHSLIIKQEQSQVQNPLNNLLAYSAI